MIKLYNFGQFGELPDPSPFCLKVDIYLRMAGLNFECVSGIDNLKKAPKGKLPFIEDEGKIVADSEFIIAYLKERYGDTLDGHLDPEQKATAHAFVKMMDENLYWCLVWSRWVSNEIWPQLKESFFGKLPFFLKDMVAKKVRKDVIKSLRGQGLGRHSEQEIKQILATDLKALSDFLGDKSFFFGDQATTLDAVAYGFLAELALAPLQSSLTEIVKNYPNLVSFCHRIQKTYYSIEG